MNFYGQNGEDFIIWEAFKDYPSGFFLDVGALDGIHLSNSLAFEQAGWKGLCVEAHPGYITRLKANRPNSICEHCAISDRDADAQDFYASALGSFSSVSADFVSYFQKHFGQEKLGYKKIKVNFRTIDTLLANNNISHVDFVSLDIEGTEYEALTKFNVAKYQPKVLVIEVLSDQRFKLITDWLAKYGYILARQVKQNAFYCLDKLTTDKIVAAKVTCKLVHTPQP